MMGSRVSWIVFKKELIDLFRDKKTLVSSILIPIIIFPLLFYVMGNSMNSMSKKVEENLNIAIKDNSKGSQLVDFIKEQKNITIVQSSNMNEDLKNGKILVAIEIPENFDEDIKNEKTVNLKMTYDNSSQSSQMAVDSFNLLMEGYSKAIVEQRLMERNISGEFLNPIKLEVITTENKDEGYGKLMLSLLLPLLLIIYSIAGPMGAAVDLGAGEKERGTLEPLLTTQAGRLSLLWGKFFAITVMGLLSTLASLLGLYISTKQDNGFFHGGAGSISIKTIILIGLITLLLTMLFGALELTISIFARSFKEAQTYISPLMIIAFVPTYATYMLDAKNIESFYFHIPLANVSCLIKELISGIYNYTHLGITFAWIAVYIVGSILFARFMFSREEVIFRT